jgi:hypothetical protein
MTRSNAIRWLALAPGLSLLANVGLASWLAVQRQRRAAPAVVNPAGDRPAELVPAPVRKAASDRVVTEGLPPGYRMILRGHPGSVSAIAIAPDNARLAIATNTGHLAVWDLRSRDLAWEVVVPGWGPNSGPIGLLAFSPSGEQISWEVDVAERSPGRNAFGIHIHNIRTGTGRTLRDDGSLRPLGDCRGLAFAPDGGTIALGFRNGVAILDVNDGTMRHLLRADKHFYFRGLSYGADGNRLLCWSAPSPVLFDARAGRPILDLKSKERHQGGACSTLISPGRDRIALSTTQNRVTLWDGTSGGELISIQEGAGSAISDGSCWATFSGDGQYLLTASRGEIGDPVFVRWRRAVDGTLIHRIAVVQPGGTVPDLYPRQFSPDGTLLALVGLKDGTRVIPQPDLGSISFSEGVVALYGTSQVLGEPADPTPVDRSAPPAGASR